MVATLLNTALLNALAGCMNRLLALDPHAISKLSPLAGKVLRVECTVPAIAVNIMICDTGLRLTGNGQISADAVIRGKPASLLKLLVTRNTAAIREAGVVMSGDAGLIDDLNAIFSTMDVDWEYRLSRVIGDIPTQLLSDGIAGTRAFVRHAGSNLADDLDAWLHEEKQLFPSAAETERFYRRIDALRLRIDRLQARADRLASDPAS